METIAESKTDNSVTGLLVDEGAVLDSCGIEIFDELLDGEFEAIIADVSSIGVENGTTFYASEDGPSYLCLLRSGRVKLYRQLASGKRLTLGIISKEGRSSVRCRCLATFRPVQVRSSSRPAWFT